MSCRKNPFEVGRSSKEPLAVKDKGSSEAILGGLKDITIRWNFWKGEGGEPASDRRRPGKKGITRR